MGNVDHTPFSALGNALRDMRLRTKESLLEVSAAIEVSGERLAMFENGELRPAEDILELLIAHYDLLDQEADKLWDLAGYKKVETQELPQQTFFFSPFEQRIMYTDMVNVMVNEHGVIMNFMQAVGPNNQPIAVSKIGMSHAHAKRIIELLSTTMQQAESTQESPKLLDDPESNQKQTAA